MLPRTGLMHDINQKMLLVVCQASLLLTASLFRVTWSLPSQGDPQGCNQFLWELGDSLINIRGERGRKDAVDHAEL